MKRLLVFILFFFLFSSCPATKSAWLNLTTGGAHHQIQLFEKKPPKDYGKYRILGKVELKKFTPLGEGLIDCPHYYLGEKRGRAALNQEIIGELQAEAYERWEKNASALIDVSCFYVTIDKYFRICECERKGHFSHKNIIHPNDTPKEIQRICSCQGGRIYWKRERLCQQAINCQATAISKNRG